MGAMVQLWDCMTAASADRILLSLLQTPEDLVIGDIMNVQQQKGGSDCEVLTIALVTSLVFA